MELQFHKVQENCLQQLYRQVHTQEQTQELKIDDTMPDIGHVLGAWGQILIRGKEWQNGMISVSGGILTWVTYTPEEDGAVQCMESWIPFQIRCQIPPSERDGSICVSPLLRNMDARSISARKLMVRANVSVLIQAMVAGKAEVCRPGEIPADVQLLKNTYLLRLPREAGEKAFTVEETLTMPASCATVKKVIRYDLQPELIDQKVMADKVVFRGMGLLHLVYLDTEDMLQNWDFEVPFSQYTELDVMYEDQADACITPILTSLELEMDEESKLHVKAGMVGQYVICDHTALELVQDAYGTDTQVLPQMELLEMPAVLDQTEQTMQAFLEIEADAAKIADVVFYPTHPETADQDTMELSGRFQVLYYDTDGILSCQTGKWNDHWTWPADSSCCVAALAIPSGTAQGVIHANGMTLTADLRVVGSCTGNGGMSMVTGLTILPKEQEGKKPGLILRRVGDDSLWQIAKQTGSTMQKIRTANGLTEDPAPDKILLIPIS